jgi:site-specific DNA-methyltransferase (adenine-specific)
LNYLRNKNVNFQNWIVWYKKDGFGPTKKRYVNNQETILFYTISNDFTFNADEIRVPYSSSSRIKAASKKGILKNGKRWFPNENGKLCTDVWEITSDRHKKKINGKVVKSQHPTPKPEDMIERMVLASSKKNDLVLDLFSGTGTTAYIAKRNSRNFIGCEINDEYIRIIENRLSIEE